MERPSRLGVDDASLATFPDEFRQGMAARAEILGTVGANHPDRWLGELGSPSLHAIVILFARDVAERERCASEHRRYLTQLSGVKVLSSLDLEALPPFDGVAREHFGYRDRLSQPVIDGTGTRRHRARGPPSSRVSSSRACGRGWHAAAASAPGSPVP
jgi:hypothetical protein